MTRPKVSNFSRGAHLAERARELIPASAHTYSKGPDQYPVRAPAFIDHGVGARCWDMDGNEFVDWGMGLRSVILGHAYPQVVDAASAQLLKGVNFTRPAPIEVELAEILHELIPSAEMVKLAKNGSDTTSAAVRLARAYTGRDLIARCSSSAFNSFYDWFIGSTVVTAGIPTVVQQLTLQFPFNDLDALEALLSLHQGKIAAVILEPAYGVPPGDGYLEGAKALAHRHGTLVIFDEVVTGFRWHLSGAQSLYGVTPDLACFGKALGNGFSASALVGRRDIMALGGLEDERAKVFLLSSTHGGETHAIAAALATISVMRDQPVIDHIWNVGSTLTDGFNAISDELGIRDYLFLDGFACYPRLNCRGHDAAPSQAYYTLFAQEMIAGGVLMPFVAPSFSHGPAEVAWTLEAARAAMAIYRQALEQKSTAHLLEGPPVKSVFRQYN